MRDPPGPPTLVACEFIEKQETFYRLPPEPPAPHSLLTFRKAVAKQETLYQRPLEPPTPGSLEFLHIYYPSLTPSPYPIVPPYMSAITAQLHLPSHPFQFPTHSSLSPTPQQRPKCSRSDWRPPELRRSYGQILMQIAWR